MIRFRSWFAHNKRVIKDAIAKRTGRGARPDAPLMLGKVLVVNNFDDNFERFASLVGGDRAETFMLRAMQYAATHDGINGAIRVSRAHFGHVVLSRNWHVVSRKVGGYVYDALLSSGICVPILEVEIEPAEPFLSTPMSADTSTPDGVDMSRLLVPVPVPVHSPPPPLAGGESSPSAAEPQDDPDADSDEPGPTGRPLRPRARERFEKMLDHACTHPASMLELPGDMDLRRRFKAGEMTDDEIRAAMDGRLKWVTKEKLARKATWTTDDREDEQDDPKPTAPPAKPPERKWVTLCGPHKRPTPCSVCDAPKEAEKRKLNGTPRTSTAEIVAQLRAQISGPKTPAAEPTKTRLEPPPEDADVRRKAREALDKPPS